MNNVEAAPHGQQPFRTVMNLGHSHQMAQARPPPAAGKRFCCLRAAGALSFSRQAKINLLVPNVSAIMLRLLVSLNCAVLALTLAACDRLGGQSAASGTGPAPSGLGDPVVARALYDPLMSDPDLTRRSEANAAIAYADHRALPILPATPEERQRARDAMRDALLTGGAIPPLSPLTAGSEGTALGGVATIADMLVTVGVPEACRKGASAGFDWAAKLAAPALIAPRGIVEEAAGSDAAACRFRAVRYLTAAPLEDALIYHDTLAQSAGFSVKRYDQPEAIIAATGQQGETLRVHLREQSNGMTAVDLVFWINP